MTCVGLDPVRTGSAVDVVAGLAQVGGKGVGGGDGARAWLDLDGAAARGLDEFADEPAGLVLDRPSRLRHTSLLPPDGRGRNPCQFSAHTELVTLGILQDNENTGLISYHAHLSGAKGYQPRNLDRASTRPVAQRSDVKMNTVLHSLSLRDPLEGQPRPLPSRILDPVPVAEILFAMPERPQGRVDAIDIGRRITKDRGPESS